MDKREPYYPPIGDDFAYLRGYLKMELPMRLESDTLHLLERYDAAMRLIQTLAKGINSADETTCLYCGAVFQDVPHAPLCIVHQAQQMME